MNEVQEDKKKRENKWIIGGSVVAILAISTPFIILWMSDKEITIKNIEGMGTVGDYLGGTTVGLLSLASIIFVVAAITMQKEELKLQRKELKETRKEYHITNQTMKKQQFETTFFNMINLHHNILSEIKSDEYNGRDFLQDIYIKIKHAYSTEVYRNYQKKAISDILNKDFQELEDIAEKFNEDICLMKYLEEVRNRSSSDEKVLQEKRLILSGEHIKWKEYLEEWKNKLIEDKNLIGPEILYKSIIEKLNIKAYLVLQIEPSHQVIRKIIEDYADKPIKDLKVKAYEGIYKKYEKQIGHYYRNLYQIVKFIEETNFDEGNEKESSERNEIEKRKYRDVLRAQLSSIEMLLLFYNVVYSKQGESFKKLLVGKSFFEDYLVEEDFIWTTDDEELKKMKILNN